MKLGRLVATAAYVFWSASAIAGDVPLYAPAPDWIAVAKLPDAQKQAATGGPVLFDVQQRIDGATVWRYSDTAFRLDTPEALSQSSNVTIAWHPDKGDLIIHELSILRDGQLIDALAGGQKFTVLRREQQLEQRELTGILSATLAVEGLRVGDTIRLRMSITAKDAALGGRAQVIQPLVAEPVRIPSAAYRLSWRADAPTQWKILADNVAQKPTRAGDFSELAVSMPIPKQPELPEDAPRRFLRPQLIEASTFSDWADVSKVMAPLYVTDGKLPAGSPLLAEIEAIKSATGDPLGRAALALQLVQDKIRYLAVGMDGGNYIPQSPDMTWERRYGDCKAKTLLLLSLLKAMGIEAEPVLVNSALGDLVPQRVPSALAFDHVLVRANIGGKSLWLDGTKIGDRLTDIRDTPALGHVLPVRAQGADLIKVEPGPPARPTIDLSMEVDESTSIDLPSVVDLNIVVRGRLANMLTLAATQLPEKENRELIDSMIQHYVGEAQYDTLSATPDAKEGLVTIKGKGVFNTGWRRQDRRSERWLSRAADFIQFEPDRARPAWTSIPVLTSAPDTARYRMRIKLPDSGKGYSIEGDQNSDTRIAGIEVKRSTVIADGAVVVEETFASSGSEIAADQVAAEKDRVTTAVARLPRIIAPQDARRRWNLKGAASGSQLESIKAVYAKTSGQADEENITALTSALSFHRGIGDFKGVLESANRQISLLPSVDALLARAGARNELGDVAGALRDAQEARKLDPASQPAVASVANFLAKSGDLPKAIALLDERIALGGKTRSDYRAEKAAIIGEFGDAQAAISELDRLIEEKPGSPELLNARCWIKGTRNIDLESGLKDCTSAIELSENAAPFLDSRALVWFRLGRDEEALRDLDAALLQAPGLAPSHFLRAIVKKRLGKLDAATDDLAIARQIAPSVERDYARFDLKP